MSSTPLNAGEGQPLVDAPMDPLRRGDTRLPAPLTTLVDRQQELEIIVELLRRPEVRLLTVTGAGGSGKTRLVIAAASHAAASFADGVAFIDLSSIVDVALVVPTIARRLGLRDMGLEPILGQLVRMLARVQLLLVLDNFEQVVESAPFLSELLGSCPGLKILVTSRVRLRLTGEREVPLGPLSLDADRGNEATVRADAVQLFVERAQAVKPAFVLDSESLSAVTEIVRRLDGLPLAIELAAVRVRALSPISLLTRLETRLPLLTGGGRDLPARQQTMRAAIAWSYDLLDPAEQALFSHLAVFAGGFTLHAAEAVCAASNTADHVLECLTALIDHSLITSVSDLRYQFLETVREYAWEQLTGRSEWDDMRGGHAAYFLALAEAATIDPGGHVQGEWLDRLEAEHANLRAAFSWLNEHDPERALRLAAALRSFWRIRGHMGEGVAVLERVLASGAGTPAARAKALVALASIRNLQTDYEAAARLAEEARRLSASIGDRHGVAEALRRIAPVHIARALAISPPDADELARAQALWEEELALRRELKDQPGIAWALMNLGVPAMARGDSAGAFEQFAQALSLFEALGDEYGIAYAYSDMGWAAALQAQGNHEQAAQLFAQALQRSYALGDHWGMSTVLEQTSWLLVSFDESERAARLLAAAAIYREADGIGVRGIRHVGYERAMATARTTLGEARFAAATAAGRQLTVETAVAEALQALALLAESRVAVRPHLTPREREVMQLLVEGKSDREIGGVLELSPRTVGVHVSHLLGKLGAETRTAAVAIALRQGLV